MFYTEIINFKTLDSKNSWLHFKTQGNKNIYCRV